MAEWGQWGNRGEGTRGVDTDSLSSHLWRKFPFPQCAAHRHLGAEASTADRAGERSPVDTAPDKGERAKPMNSLPERATF